ncbi:MAG: hypothetical protein ACQESN_11290 [Thermotogota bacterium]
MISNEFKEWACSFSGCEGAINADTWLCGIEPGGGTSGDGNYYEKELKDEIQGRAVNLANDDGFDWQESLSYRYGISFAKLYSAIRGKNVEYYKENAKTFSSEELLKLNLYPIAFDNTSNDLWRKYELDKLTGFDEKHLFQTWCFFHRFPVFTKMRQDKKPELIICTGTGYFRDFMCCFAGDVANLHNVQHEDIMPEPKHKVQNPRRCYWVKLDNPYSEKKTTLVIIPFFSGKYGLNSNFLLDKVGKKIGSII